MLDSGQGTPGTLLLWELNSTNKGLEGTSLPVGKLPGCHSTNGYKKVTTHICCRKQKNTVLCYKLFLSVSPVAPGQLLKLSAQFPPLSSGVRGEGAGTCKGAKGMAGPW